MKKKNAFLLELIAYCKKNNPQLLLLLNRCKFSYFIAYKCLNLERERPFRMKEGMLTNHRVMM